MAGNPLSRRRVLQGSAVAAVGVAGPPLLEGTGSAAAMPPGGGAADLVLHNGQIVTMGPGFHIASAVLVPHGPVFPSFAFRFDTDEGSVVFSGDTSKSANVVRLAEGADVLVHEAIDLDFYREAGAPPAVLSHLEQSHTPTPQAGQVAAEAGVRTLVLNHLAPGATGTVPDGRWISRAKKHFSGRVVRAHELQNLPLR